MIKGTADTRFLYDGADIIAEYDAAGTVLKRYVHGPGLDEPLVWYEGSGTNDRRYLLADERGSVIGVVNNAGTVTVNKYDEFGVPATGNAGRFQYTGQIWLAELGLYHYKARAYDPYLGRFLQPDPIGYAGGMNLYGYAGNDPVNRRDPFGLLDCPEGPSIDNISCQPTALEEIHVRGRGCDMECRRRHEEEWAAFAKAQRIQDLLEAINAANAAVVANLTGMVNAAGAAMQAIYGETAGLYPQLTLGTNPHRSSNWNAISLKQLQTARSWIAEVQSRNHNVKYARPSSNDPIEQQVWHLSLIAALEAGELSPETVRHFFIRQEGVGPQTPSWAAGDTSYRSFGPFINVGGGDVPVGPATYIDFYQSIQ